MPFVFCVEMEKPGKSKPIRDPLCPVNGTKLPCLTMLRLLCKGRVSSQSLFIRLILGKTQQQMHAIGWVNIATSGQIQNNREEIIGDYINIKLNLIRKGRTQIVISKQAVSSLF